MFTMLTREKSIDIDAKKQKHVPINTSTNDILIRMVDGSDNSDKKQLLESAYFIMRN